MKIQVGQHWHTRAGYVAEVLRAIPTGLPKYTRDWKPAGKITIFKCRGNACEFFVDDRGFYIPSDGEHALDLVKPALTVVKAA